jgi:hypothetical protein
MERMSVLWVDLMTVDLRVAVRVEAGWLGVASRV